VYARPGFAYTPSVVIDMDLLVKNLFCFPRYDHYYFGDYYDARYQREGIYPWFESASHHEYFDPIFAHRQWRNRDNHEWIAQVKTDYGRRQKEPDARPARTYTALQAQMARLPEAKRGDFHVAQPLSSYVDRKDSPLKFRRVTPEQQAEIMKQTAAQHDFKDQRRTWEAPPAVAAGGDHGKPPVTGHEEVKAVTPTPHIIVPPPHVSTPPVHIATPPEHVVATPPVFVKPETPRVQTKEPVEFTTHTTKLPTPSPVVGPKVETLQKDFRPPPVPATPQPNPDIKPRFSGPTGPRDDHKDTEGDRGRGRG
jgi:hypothetical protein